MTAGGYGAHVFEMHRYVRATWSATDDTEKAVILVNIKDPIPFGFGFIEGSFEALKHGAYSYTYQSQ